MPPTLANGKICYIEIPALDIERSAAFYGAVFGWNIRKRTDGTMSFDDGVGEVSGSWVTGRPARGLWSPEPQHGIPVCSAGGGPPCTRTRRGLSPAPR